VNPTPSGAPAAVTSEPRLTRRVDPEYPDGALRKGIEGYVEVSFTITAQGTVTNVAVVTADPVDVFDRAAIEAVRRYRYDPRMVNGQPVESQSHVRLHFKPADNAGH
jgi:protein TonB